MTPSARRGRRPCLTLAAALLAALVAAACGRTEARNDAATRAVSTVAVTAVPARQEALPATVELTGTLTADARADVAAEVDGRVARVAVERGTPVTAGDALAELAREDALNQLREAEALEAQTAARLGLAAGGPFEPGDTPEARRARVVAERAEADYQRFARLVEHGAVSRSEHDLRRAEAAAARAQLEETLNQVRQLHRALEAQRVRVAMAKKALGDTVIRAPWAGVVAERHVAAGDYVKRGGRVATLVRVDPLRIELAVPESAVAAVRPGQSVAFAVQTHPGRVFQGTIAYVGPALRADSRALVVEALVPNGRGALQPGLFATARVELPRATPSVLVPAAALRSEAGVWRLYVVREGRAELRLVQVGREVGGALEVVRGVAPGERVVTGPLDRLADGAPVTDGAAEAR